MLENSRLQEKALAGALRVTRDAKVIRVGKRLKWISNILDLNLGKFSRAHLFFDDTAKRLFTLGRRIVVVVFLFFEAQMARVFDAHVTFNGPVVKQAKLTSAFLERSFGSGQRGAHPERFFRVQN